MKYKAASLSIQSKAMVSRHLLSTLISLPILGALKILSELMPYTRQGKLITNDLITFSGFFCDDDEIRFPYREDSIKSRFMLFLFGVAACILVRGSL
jgi:hypothetical protein